MTVGGPAALELPRSLRSPWRWVTFGMGVMLVLVGVGGVAGGENDLASVLIACTFVASGMLLIYLSWRSGVLIDREHVQERGFAWKTERMSWADVVEVKVVPGASMLPSRTVLLVGRNAEESITLSSLSWYSFRAGRMPARVAEFTAVASALMGER
jgi:hypothetical protein